MCLGSVLEFVAVMAAGMAYARMALLETSPLSGFFSVSGLSSPLGLAILLKQFLFGVGLAGGVGLWIERGRGRHPEPWGFGRWSWSLVAAFYFFLIAWRASSLLVDRWVHGTPLDMNYLLFKGSEEVTLQISFPGTCALLVALWITYRLSGQARDPAPDAREWAGRAFLAFNLVHLVLFKALRTIDQLS